MSLDASLEKLVRDLDDAALEELRAAAAREAGQRQQQAALRLEDIHANMSAEAKRRATEHIARLLRGEE